MGTLTPVYWISPVPPRCNLCNTPIGETFIDGKLRRGTRWAYMCPNCWMVYGAFQFGVGLGQRYVRQADNRFLKVEG